MNKAISSIPSTIGRASIAMSSFASGAAVSLGAIGSTALAIDHFGMSSTLMDLSLPMNTTGALSGLMITAASTKALQYYNKRIESCRAHQDRLLESLVDDSTWYDPFEREDYFFTHLRFENLRIESKKAEIKAWIKSSLVLMVLGASAGFTAVTGAVAAYEISSSSFFQHQK